MTSTSPERREETGFKQELEILRYYDTVILVDDSSSMVGGRWREVCVDPLSSTFKFSTKHPL